MVVSACFFRPTNRNAKFFSTLNDKYINKLQII
jgi:hypothetical protein